MNEAKTAGVMLMALGGPESLQEVGDFMSAILGRPSPPPLVEAVVERYKMIGGKSPLPTIVRSQAEGLGRELKGQVVSLAGFLHSQPKIPQTLLRFIAKSIRKIIALPMSPYYTSITSGAYLKALDEARRDLRDLEIVFIESWHDHASFIKAWIDIISKSLTQFPVARRRQVPVIFSAHSIPMRYIENGEPYRRQLEETADKIAKSLGLDTWWLAYQSKGIRSVEAWLEPGVEKVLDEIEGRGYKDVLQVPLGFTCDHLETLYDIDIGHREYAREKGLDFYRIESLNASPLFLKALADIVREYL